MEARYSVFIGAVAFVQAWANVFAAAQCFGWLAASCFGMFQHPGVHWESKRAKTAEKVAAEETLVRDDHIGLRQRAEMMMKNPAIAHG